MTIEMEHVRTLNNFKKDYSYLLKEFLTISKPHIGARSLETLKSDFSSIIKSERTSDYIKSLEGLLRILEKRDRLSHDNIEPLMHISSNYVRDPELERLLTNYNERIKDRPFVPLFNVYDLPNAPLYETQPDNQHSTGSQIHQIRAQMTLFATAEPSFRFTLPGVVNVGPSDQNLKDDDAEIAKIVLFEVSEKVGRHWRDVARFLGVTENDIDEIDLNCQWSLKEKALKALLNFQSKCEPLQWKTKLKGALEKARRRDLMEMVDDLLSRKYQTN